MSWEDQHPGFRLYCLLALFDTRDGSYISQLVASAREGYEGAEDEDSGEFNPRAWEDFDHLWDMRDSLGRIREARAWKP